MSNYPNSLDDDSTIPSVYDNVTEVGAEAINALKEALLNIEEELGFSLSGSVDNLSTRLNVALNPDGTINSSAILGLGLVTLPIDNSQIATLAGIDESKLNLDYSTTDLYNLIQDLGIDSNTAIGWINLNSSKVLTHIAGTAYNHYTSQILVAESSSNYLNNKYDSARNNSNLYNLLDDINSDFVEHQKLDGYGSSSSQITTINNNSYPDNYAHHALGLYIDSSRFISIPKTIQDVQSLSEFVDTTSLLLFGSRVQNLFSNGISNASRSSTFNNDGYGQILIDYVSATAYLRTDGTATSPIDDIDSGDDIIELTPSGTILSSNLFDAQFNLVSVGDIVSINYGTIETRFIIKEKKYIQNGGNKKFIIRINGKNLKYTTSATVLISKPQYNINKNHVLALAQANNEFAENPSLIAIHPKAPSVLGLNFNPNLFDKYHYNLYIQMYVDGDVDNVVTLPAIDVTGNQGATPGKYTLESIIRSTNDAFREAGKNYRFAAFQRNGEFGLAMTDPYLNCYFSIINAVVDSSGFYNQSSTQSNYPNNVIDVFNYYDNLDNVQNPKDPLGFGIYNSNVSSPPYSSSYSTAEQAIPTKIYVPLTKNTYYVNGVEKDQFGLEVDQTIDEYGDGYWLASVTNQNIVPGTRVETTYQIDLDLRSSKLEVGKTIVIQKLNDGYGYFVDFGRFIINDVSCVVCSPDSAYTTITVYDAVHGQDSSPQTTLSIGSEVRLYFSNDSIGFNLESSTDEVSVTQFKKFFEVYINSDGNTFSHERARYTTNSVDLSVNSQTLNASQSISSFNITEVSSKLKGYKFGSINKISLRMISFDSNGIYTGYLCKYDGYSYQNQGPLTTGYVGEKTRFFDESNIDFIELKLSLDHTVSSFSDQTLDIQIFPSLQLDKEVYLLGNCMLQESTNTIEELIDKRDFGNISEKELNDSAINFISLGEKYLHTNGVVNGFDLDGYGTNPSNNQIYLQGGTALINGKFILMNNSTVEIPILKENYLSTDYSIIWAVCLNDKSEYVTYPLLDQSGASTAYSSGITSRRFLAVDPSTGSTFRIEALNKDTLLNRKDLLVLYTALSSISGSSSPFTVALTTNDVRKYAYSTDSISVKYSANKEFGNFRSAKTLFNWLSLNSNNISHADIKGADEEFDSGSTISISSNSSLIEIDGGNNATLTFSNNTKLSISGVVLKNMTINFESTIPNLFLLSNSKLINCSINGEYISSLASSGYFMFISNSDLIDCSVSLRYDGSGFSTDKTLLLSGSNTNISNLDGYMDAQFISDATPNFITSSSSNIKITNSSFSGNFRKVLELTNSSNVEFVKNTIDTTFSGSYDSSYNSSYLCNYASGGVLDINVSSQIQNIYVLDNEFTANNISDRLSFIGVKFSATNASIKNLRINDNRFLSTGLTNIDMNAAIHIVTHSSTTNGSTVGYLIDSQINKNYCNSHQNIILSSTLHSDDKMYLKMAVNNVSISDNICGSIGYFAVSGSKYTYSVATYPSAFTSSNSINFDLNINNNNCKYIRLADSLGRTFVTALDSPANTTALATCSTKIVNNNSSFIHVGSTSQTSMLLIDGNNIPGYSNDYTLLDPFVNSSYASVLAAVILYPICVTGLATSNNGICTITNNFIYKSNWVNPSSGVITTNYPSGYIRSDVQAIIKNNNCTGTGNSGPYDLIIVGAGNCNISDNYISRESVAVSSFMKFYDYISGSSGSSTIGIVTNNIFNSYTIDGTNDNLLKGNFPNNWIVNQNINQVEYANFSLSSQKMEYDQSTTVKNLSRDTSVVVAPLQTSLVDVESLITVISTLNTDEKWYSNQWNLNNHLPANTKIFGCKMNIRKDSGTPTLNVLSSFLVNITKLTTSFANQEANIDVSSTAITNIATDDPYISTTVSDNVLGAEFNSASVGSNILISLSSSSLESGSFVINNGTPIILGFRANYSVTSGTLNMLISPILIKYRW